MCPRTKDKLEQIRESKKELILHVSLELFATRGIHSTSMDEIAKTAGISKGLIYNYFNSKDDLIKEILFSVLKNLEMLFDPNKDGVLETDEFEYLIVEVVNMVKSNPKFWRLYFTLMIKPEAQYILSEGHAREQFSFMMDEMKEYLENKGFENPTGEVMLLHALFDGVIMNYSINPDQYPIDEVAKIVINRYCK